MKNLCIYHRTDPDGWCSGALVYNHCVLEMGNSMNFSMRGMDYDDEFPWDMVDSDTRVWMVDFSLSGPDMWRLHESCRNLTWIDHHGPRIEEVNEYFAGLKNHRPITLSGVRRTDKAACELLWEYLYPEEEMHPVVYLLGRYDVWKWHDVPDALEFNVGIRTMNGVDDPESSLWRLVLDKDEFRRDEEIIKIVRLGGQLLDYRNRNWWLYAKGHTFKTVLTAQRKGEDCPVNYVIGACNTDSVNSQFFDGPAMQERFPDVDFFMTFAWKRGQWRLGLWKPDWLKNDIHCGEIAKEFGGGGHPGAAGFYTTKLQGLPFRLK